MGKFGTDVIEFFASIVVGFCNFLAGFKVHGSLFCHIGNFYVLDLGGCRGQGGAAPCPRRAHHYPMKSKGSVSALRLHKYSHSPAKVSIIKKSAKF